LLLKNLYIKNLRFFGGAEKLKSSSIHKILLSFHQCIYSVYNISSVNYITEGKIQKKKINQSINDNILNKNPDRQILIDIFKVANDAKCIIRCAILPVR
jgi:hypothetical protein